MLFLTLMLIIFNLLISLLLMDFSILVAPWRKDGVYPACRTMLFFAENLLVLSVICDLMYSKEYEILFLKLSEGFSVSIEATSPSLLPVCLLAGRTIVLFPCSERNFEVSILISPTKTISVK